jgi:glycerol-1-phosphate dehydrogenase [NAD(P)+]
MREPGDSGVRGRDADHTTAHRRDTDRADTPEGALDALLRGAWIDPDDGAAIGVAIDAIVVERSLAGEEAGRVAALRLGRRLAVVSDAVTHDVLGARIERALRTIAHVDSVVLPAHPHADMPTVEAVRAGSASADALIAVGSGTINDLAKFAAAQDRKPYAVFATAPSMNGYTSANAAITVDGHKKTLPATLARGVFVDLAIFAAAPPRMIRAGLGDSLCRPTAQIDWLLSHHALGTPYRSAPFALLAPDEPVLFAAPEALLAGDLDAMRALAQTLVLSGIGMTLCGSSAPASQGEHLISHYVDMRTPAGRPPYLHGEQVAVATLTMARLQEAVLDAPPPVVRASIVDADALCTHFGADVGAQCWQEFAPKRLTSERAAQLTARLATTWERLRRDAAAARVAADRLGDIMRRIGGPRRPSDIGLEPSFYADAVRHARFLRNRYTFLDLAADAGVLDGHLAA